MVSHPLQLSSSSCHTDILASEIIMKGHHASFNYRQFYPALVKKLGKLSSLCFGSLSHRVDRKIPHEVGGTTEALTMNRKFVSHP